MKLIFGDEFIFYTSSMYEICLHCHCFGFSSWISNNVWTKYGSVAVNCEKKDGYLYALAFVSELASCFCLCTLKGKHWNAAANGTGCNFPINSLLDEVIN